MSTPTSSSNANVVRSTALRAGGACVRCRKGKTKCVYENGRAPCKNCAKGMHECYLPSESLAHHSGQSPARHVNNHRPSREHLPSAGSGGSTVDSRQPIPNAANPRHSNNHVTPDKLTPELIAECERVVSKTFPACVAFHKPSFVQQLKNATLEPSLVYGLLTCAARSSPALIRRYNGPTTAAESFATKAVNLINQNLDHSTLGDIQALCLIVIHEWGTRNALRAYIYLGQATRMLQMYRILNTHRASEGNDQFLRDESFRRTLWLIYLLDCFLTSTPGRFPALSAQDYSDVSLPCSDINFAFGNAVYVKTIAQQLDPHRAGRDAPAGEVGELGYIVLAATVWRDVVTMLTSTSLQSFREEDCHTLISKIETLRASLPMQFVDKPGQINLHMTMGSGYTFAMLHCLLHCATVFVHRRRLLQEVTASSFHLESFRLSQRCHDIIDRLFTSCHGTISLLNAVETGAEKDQGTCFPIFMLFSSFTASSTIAYLSLKGLTPPNAVETAAHIVKEGLHFMSDGNENWPLMSSWLRHLTVMQRVLNNDAAAVAASVSAHVSRHGSSSHLQAPSVKDEVSSNADSHADGMDYDQNTTGGTLPPIPPVPRSVSESVRGDSEPPAATVVRRPGIATINGGGAGGTSGSLSSGPPTSPPPLGSAPHAAMGLPETKPPTPESGILPNHSDGPTTSQDMTAPELCAAFERQLLDLDDLAAFMGGGV